MLEITPLSPFLKYFNFEEVTRHFEIFKRVLVPSSKSEVLIGLSLHPILGLKEMNLTPLGRIKEPKKNLPLNTLFHSKTTLDCLLSDHLRFKNFA